jgi:predicted transcriptional regulator
MTAMTLRLPDAVHEALRESAQRQGRSMQSVAVEAIDRYVTDRIRRRDEALARIVAEDAAILDRLA